MDIILESIKCWMEYEMRDDTFHQRILRILQTGLSEETSKREKRNDACREKFPEKSLNTPKSEAITTAQMFIMCHSKVMIAYENVKLEILQNNIPNAYEACKTSEEKQTCKQIINKEQMNIKFYIQKYNDHINEARIKLRNVYTD